MFKLIAAPLLIQSVRKPEYCVIEIGSAYFTPSDTPQYLPLPFEYHYYESVFVMGHPQSNMQGYATTQHPQGTGVNHSVYTPCLTMRATQLFQTNNIIDQNGDPHPDLSVTYLCALTSPISSLEYSTIMTDFSGTTEEFFKKVREVATYHFGQHKDIWISSGTQTDSTIHATIFQHHYAKNKTYCPQEFEISSNCFHYFGLLGSAIAIEVQQPNEFVTRSHRRVLRDESEPTVGGHLILKDKKGKHESHSFEISRHRLWMFPVIVEKYFETGLK